MKKTVIVRKYFKSFGYQYQKDLRTAAKNS